METDVARDLLDKPYSLNLLDAPKMSKFSSIILLRSRSPQFLLRYWTRVCSQLDPNTSNSIIPSIILSLVAEFLISKSDRVKWKWPQTQPPLLSLAEEAEDRRRSCWRRTIWWMTLRRMRSCRGARTRTASWYGILQNSRDSSYQPTSSITISPASSGN